MLSYIFSSQEQVASHVYPEDPNWTWPHRLTLMSLMDRTTQFYT